MLNLGVSRKIITPKVGCNLCGYFPDIISESVHDELTLTALCFCNGENRALMISATVCSLGIEMCKSIASLIEEKYGIPKTNCLIHATHTHSGPFLSGGVGWGEVDTEYYEEIFLPALLAAVGEAISSLTPVKMGIASGNSYIGVNRRELTAKNRIRLGQNTWAPFNPQMTVIAFQTQDGKPLANIVHYGMHGTCAGVNHEISRDWSGVMIDALDNISGGITAFFNGPEGDAGPRLSNGSTTGGGDIRYAEEQGALAAKDAIKIYQSISKYKCAEISLLSAAIRLPLDKRISLEEAKEGYEKFKGFTQNVNAQKADYYKRQIELYEQGYVDKEFREIPQTLLQIGEAAFVSFPFEPFSEIGMRICRESKIPYTLPLALTNGSEGYFVTEDQICRGGYEVEMFKTGNEQPYADNTDWHIVTGTLENLEKLEKLEKEIDICIE